VADAAGAEVFELRIAGPGEVVERMLADATFDLICPVVAVRRRVGRRLPRTLPEPPIGDPRR
jgi:hypothetical protein